MRDIFTYFTTLVFLILLSFLISCTSEEEMCPSYPDTYTFSVLDFDPVAAFDYDGTSALRSKFTTP